MQETQGGDKVVTDLKRERVDEDETMMGENEVITKDISRVEVTTNLGDNVENSLNRSLEDSLGDMQNDEPDAWVKLCMRPFGVKWPDPWCHPPNPDYDNNQWNLAILRVQENRVQHEMEVCPDHYTNIIKSLTQQVKTGMGTKACWLDVEHEKCNQEEASHRKKKKKQKRQGIHQFNNMHGKHPESNTIEDGAMHGNDTGKKHKIWFSRNRRPAKNILLQKIQFSQEAIPVTASINWMGMGGFKTGHAKSKESNPKDNIKESHMSRMDNLFDDLVARRVKLKEIASNINTTDENKKLVNSLLAMKSYKVLKFSAKKNEAGQVTFDENMVEQDKGPDTNIPTPNKGTQSTYAAMLTGQTSGLIYERNILNRPAKNAPPASSNKNSQASNQDSITHPINTFHHGTSVQPLTGKPNAPRTHSNRVKDPSIDLLETSNRFVLLDDEGNELPSIQEGTSQQPNDNENNFARGNDRWRMKQERLINIKYMKLVTQEQRYEAKRYVIDRLVPLDSSISEWSKPIASLREEHDNMDTIIEEVESEEDGTAEMMKSDCPSIPITSEGTEEGLASFKPTDMLVDGKNAGIN
ncbi:hypothetical protein L1987_56723 [Smallanthus sonchifolius]|uniref:Uncharacterized protein n=1 Tax=Smallanthus sonchifolius TaxID=185202 RepID=A0ACB9EEM1_9ASTR|nr:hypothetical protein L1987_56723 [Smallanthus sonchifolius]